MSETTLEMYRCSECNCIFELAEILKADNPFKSNGEIWGCPNCKEVDTFMRLCDVTDCFQAATAGKSTNLGYKYLCYSHYKSIPDE